MERRNNAATRSTRLSLQIPVIVTSLDPARDFHKECKTAFVNAHSCAIVVQERLANETPLMLKLVSNGASKKTHVVLAVPLLESVAWLLGAEFESPGNFWESEIRQQPGASEAFLTTIACTRHTQLSIHAIRIASGSNEQRLLRSCRGRR